MPPSSPSTPGARSRHARRTIRRCLAIALAVGACAVSLLLIAPVRQHAANGGRGSTAAPLYATGNLLRQSQDTRAQEVNWKDCLEPKDAGTPMTKEQFLQQAPARCAPSSSARIMEAPRMRRTSRKHSALDTSWKSTLLLPGYTYTGCAGGSGFDPLLHCMVFNMRLSTRRSVSRRQNQARIIASHTW